MLIREASIEDYPQLRQIYLESRRQSFHWLNTEEIKLQDFDQDTKEEQIFLAEESNKILGFISLYVPDRFIHLLFVHPEALWSRGWRFVAETCDQSARNTSHPQMCIRKSQSFVFLSKKRMEGCCRGRGTWGEVLGACL